MILCWIEGAHTEWKLQISEISSSCLHSYSKMLTNFKVTVCICLEIEFKVRKINMENVNPLISVYSVTTHSSLYKLYSVKIECRASYRALCLLCSQRMTLQCFFVEVTLMTLMFKKQIQNLKMFWLFCAE